MMANVYQNNVLIQAQMAQVENTVNNDSQNTR